MDREKGEDEMCRAVECGAGVFGGKGRVFVSVCGGEGGGDSGLCKANE